MCGICGFFQSEPKAGEKVLRAMNGRIVHRGPDDEGYFFDGRAGLAARRLSIIDLSTGHQPLSSASENSWIAYNGEVYNFDELRSGLLAKGVSFRTHSDTEVVVNLYEEFGLDFVGKLRGMFAFAIFDRKNGRLVLARDRIGKKPLHYAVLPGNAGLVFASEIKSILEYPGIEREVDPEALDLFLTLEYIPAPLSIFKGIRKLPAGHILILENGKITISRYWDVERRDAQKTFAELREEFLGLLEESVRIRMISDVPLGAFLSGGIDSSAIVAMMARISPRPVKTFSIGFEEKSYSELEYSRRVAELFGTDHYVRTLSPDIADLVVRLSRILDEPLGDFSNFPTYLVSKTAREEVTVVLSGDGGDEIFGGYEHYIAQKIGRSLDFPLLRSLGIPLSKASRFFTPSDLKKGAVNRIKRFSEGLGHSARNRHFRWMLFLSAEQKKRLYAPAFLREDFLDDICDRQPFAAFFESSRRFDGINRDLYLDLKTYLVDDIMVKVDRMSMAASLEARAPLLDHKLVEFAFSLPPEMKVRGATTKWFFKKAMEGILPPEVIYRRKEGFSIPIKSWLKGELKDLMLEYLSEKRIRDLGIFNPGYVASMIDDHLHNRENHSHRLWTLILFHLWHDHFVRGRE